MNTKNVALRRSQFRLADSAAFPLFLARTLVAGKIRNQRTMLQRNHIEPKPASLAGMKSQAERAERAPDLETLLGIEGYAARIYFEEFAGMIKPSEDPEAPPSSLNFDFEGRNRRPPRDPVNALLSLAYSMLSKDLTIACYAVGFDPYMGFYHQLRHGRPALALDLMEPFRPLIADSAVLSAINTKMVTERDFVRAGGAVALTPSGRKGFFRAYELRMDSLVTHPLFEYRVSYRRLLGDPGATAGESDRGRDSRIPCFCDSIEDASGAVARKSRHPLARCKLLNRSVNIDRGIPIYDCGRALRSTARMFGLRSLKIEDLGDTLFPRLISRGLIEATICTLQGPA
jgi:CRISPR-associated endonuclease Cas1